MPSMVVAAWRTVGGVRSSVLANDRAVAPASVSTLAVSSTVPTRSWIRSPVVSASEATRLPT